MTAWKDPRTLTLASAVTKSQTELPKDARLLPGRPLAWNPAAVSFVALRFSSKCTCHAGLAPTLNTADAIVPPRVGVACSGMGSGSPTDRNRAHELRSPQHRPAVLQAGWSVGRLVGARLRGPRGGMTLTCSSKAAWIRRRGAGRRSCRRAHAESTSRRRPASHKARARARPGAEAEPRSERARAPRGEIQPMPRRARGVAAKWA